MSGVRAIVASFGCLVKPPAWARRVEEYLAGLEEALDAELVIVVYGVATDVCVKHAIDGTPMGSSRPGSGADSSR
jgi:hypothetical protein